jgi:hypothetical protein
LAADLPVPTKFRYWQFALYGGSKGTEALAVVPVETHGRLQESVTLRAFAGLERLDALQVKPIDVGRNARVERGKPSGALLGAHRTSFPKLMYPAAQLRLG